MYGRIIEGWLKRDLEERNFVNDLIAIVTFIVLGLLSMVVASITKRR